mmetsp:Transcript_9206/g.23640  ORF Transcript_9206/g.23640 Transcript_9206/m.23640 type:complete len:211 (+) Transcript_9206:311-943(+)
MTSRSRFPAEKERKRIPSQSTSHKGSFVTTAAAVQSPSSSLVTGEGTVRTARGRLRKPWLKSRALTPGMTEPTLWHSSYPPATTSTTRRAAASPASTTTSSTHPSRQCTPRMLWPCLGLPCLVTTTTATSQAAAMARVATASADQSNLVNRVHRTTRSTRGFASRGIGGGSASVTTRSRSRPSSASYSWTRRRSSTSTTTTPGHSMWRVA